MFQYCFFLYLRKKQIETKLDITDFEKYKLHNGFELNRVFGISDEDIKASYTELELIKDQKPNIKYRKLLGRFLFQNVNHYIKKTHWIESNYSKFYKDIHNIQQTYLDGYWQNENYLTSNEAEIRQIFQWKTISSKNINLAKKMVKEESISLHIRRLDSPNTILQIIYKIRIHIVFRTATKGYYSKAIKCISDRVRKPVFYVFTDNIYWVKKNIPFSENFTIIDWNRGLDSNQDMFLMTNCRHNIISMSSFSWWGAWLNANPDKIVIAPKKWAPRFTSNYGIVPKNWIEL